MFNRITLIGRLTADPELKHTEGGIPYCNFTVAVDRPMKKNPDGSKDDRGADFIDCVAFRGTAETLAQYKKKGDPIVVEGRLEIRSYDDKNGVRRRASRVITERITFLPTNGKRVEEADDPFASLSDEDIPF